MTTPAVSVVVVSFGHGATLGGTLASLSALGRDLRDVTVVDNAGDLADGLVRRCSPVEPRLLCPGSNLGYAAAANLGVSAGRGEALLFLSPDADLLYFDRERALRLLEEPVGAIGALTRDALDRPAVSWGEFPGVRRAVRRVAGARRRFDRWVLEAAATGRSVTVPWLLGAAVLMRRRTFVRVGGYDPVYTSAGEDQDFGRRLGLEGLRSVVSSSLRVRHQPRSAATFSDVIRGNDIRFLERHGCLLDRVLARGVGIR